jgi:hypothetical protein
LKGLIEERQSTGILDNSEDSSNETISLKQQQQEKERKTMQENRINEILQETEGKTIAKTLIFLTDVRICICS